MTTSDEAEFEAKLKKVFGKRFRVVAQNSKGLYSASWVFWGKRNDYYFAARSAGGVLKVSLHENGRGYVAYDGTFLKAQLAEGAPLNKTQTEWKLPLPPDQGAAHIASLLLPADYCSHALKPNELKNTLQLGIEDGCCVEIGIFIHREMGETIEHKFIQIGGHPLQVTTLENGLNISIVVRSRSFDPSVLPTSEQTNRAKRTEFAKFKDIENKTNLNAMIWNDPGDGGTLQVIDIGGIKINEILAPSH